MLKFIVLSDLHLLQEGQTYAGLDPADRLRRAIDQINDRHSDADFCVLAGDLVDLGDRPSYERLEDLLADLTVPVHMTLGNHDNRDTFLQVFGDDLAAPTGFVDKVIDAGGYRILLIDSLLDGEVTGRIEPQQLDWIRDRLAEAADRPVIVVTHHHINRLHNFMDRYLLQNSDALLDVLTTHAQVHHIITGHVHSTTTSIRRGIPCSSLAGSHYNIKLHRDPTKLERREGPAQMAVVLADADQVVIHFDDYIDRHVVLP
ncbi:phosphodiesterase [Pseudaestuariivita rosea]|uniref:phosphodiesterase n=1 Tax=Pseudaestuariivita rosea TaxID=2763263 RepID=UPI001ABA54C4|nr:phosphodiesterase [Pseudaestuariivita rosea]